ncbi:MAG: 1,4-alpha-glucan branching protein GlgB [Defluviitaleaceae bacterium]|nr:1,4-alpha-glucan branching protein GlgB [Defluviitaleaceae bacterium]
MNTTADMYELMMIINGEHADPHHVLGPHDATLKKKRVRSIRVFNPDAFSVRALDEADPSKAYGFELIHTSGFFEATIPAGGGFDKYALEFTGHGGERWIARDPYSFAPVLTELDLYLYANGTHYEIFDKLGAQPMTVDGADGVLFAVWAPNARRVSVVGEFNGWNGLRNPMRALRSSGVWELFIPGLKNYDKYKFEIRTPSGAVFLKADPFAHFAELRPNTASFVYDINKHAWNDSDWMKKRSKNDPLDGPMNIYEAHAGSWRRRENDGGRFYSWPELSSELIPYVKEMGYTHIELLPVMEHPFDGSWGYQVTGYYAPTSRHGSPDEFMSFVDDCHANGIGVILDWVPAHFPKDSHGLARFDGTPLYEHEDPRRGEQPDWGTFVFNYGRKEVMNFLIANALFWIEKYHIDGLRVDAVASMLYLDFGKRAGQWAPNQYGGRENREAEEFIKHMNSVIRGKHPNVMMIAEESTEWKGVTKKPEDNGLGFSLKWNMGWMNDFLSYMKLDSAFRKYRHNNLTFGMIYAYTENFVLVLSHDEVVHGKGSMANKMPGDIFQKLANLRAAYGFMMGHPGKKLLFMGGEFGQFEEWYEGKALNWFLLENYEHHRLTHRFVRDLNRLYLSEKACWADDFGGSGFEWINCDDADRSLISFYRAHEKTKKGRAGQPDKTSREYLVFVCNFTPVAHADYRVGLPCDCKLTEALNSDDTSYGGSGNVNPGTLKPERHLCDGKEYSVPIKLPPLSVVILKGRADF